MFLRKNEIPQCLIQGIQGWPIVMTSHGRNIGFQDGRSLGSIHLLEDYWNYGQNVDFGVKSWRKSRGIWIDRPGMKMTCNCNELVTIAYLLMLTRLTPDVLGTQLNRFIFSSCFRHAIRIGKTPLRFFSRTPCILQLSTGVEISIRAWTYII